MKTKIFLFISGIQMLLLTSCFDNLDCIRGDGFVDNERRRVSAFDQIENQTAFDIVFTMSDTSGISITADENIIDNIVTETIGSRLEIKTMPRDACFNYTQRPVIQISSPGIKSVLISGSGNFIADHMQGEAVNVILSGSGDINAEHLNCSALTVLLSGSGSISLNDIDCTDSDIFISGSGNVMVAGSCERTNMKISGSGNIHGGNFIAGSASVMISGSGDAYTNILDKLTGLISGSGNIYVKGDPDINVVLSGSGRVIKN